ncbi:MAG TPA: sugar phosphate isomerase/epimerase [Chryseosolibacter sp.]
MNILTEPMNRRQFVVTAGAGLLLSSTLSNCKSGGETKSMAKIGLQLYTVREQIAKDIKGTLQRVAEFGFHGVETGFWPEGVTIEDAGKLIKEAGLNVFSAHCEIPVGENKSTFLRIADAFECKRMVWHGWPEDQRYKTAEGVKALTELYNESSKFAKNNGLQFGIHNHWWEFHNKIGDRFAYEVLLDELDKDIFFELDTYWLKTAGHDPATIVSEFGSRAPMLHIKDGPARYNDDLANDETPMTPVGKGTQNFPAIVKAAKGNTEWMIVEMDRTAGDVFDAIDQSYKYLVGNDLAEGKKSIKG